MLEQRNDLTMACSLLPFSLLDHRQELAAMGVDFLFLDLSCGPLRREIASVSSLLAQGGRQRGKSPEVMTGNFNGSLA